MDPPCVARENVSWRVRSCTNVSGLVLELMLRTIMEIRARPSSLAAMPPKGYVGHQFSDALERPFLHLLFFSRRPRWAKDRVALTSRFSFRERQADLPPDRFRRTDGRHRSVCVHWNGIPLRVFRISGGKRVEPRLQCRRSFCLS